jgi:hypothetical protein
MMTAYRKLAQSFSATRRAASDPNMMPAICDVRFTPQKRTSKLLPTNPFIGAYLIELDRKSRFARQDRPPPRLI